MFQYHELSVLWGGWFWDSLTTVIKYSPWCNSTLWFFEPQLRTFIFFFYISFVFHHKSHIFFFFWARFLRYFHHLLVCSVHSKAFWRRSYFFYQLLVSPNLYTHQCHDLLPKFWVFYFLLVVVLIFSLKCSIASCTNIRSFNT